MCKEFININIKLNICRNNGRLGRYAHGSIGEKEKSSFETESQEIARNTLALYTCVCALYVYLFVLSTILICTIEQYI